MQERFRWTEEKGDDLEIRHLLEKSRITGKCGKSVRKKKREKKKERRKERIEKEKKGKGKGKGRIKTFHSNVKNTETQC